MSAEEAAGCGLVAKVVDDLDSSVHQQLETSFLPRSSAALKIACQSGSLAGEPGSGRRPLEAGTPLFIGVDGSAGFHGRDSRFP